MQSRNSEDRRTLPRYDIPLPVKIRLGQSDVSEHFFLVATLSNISGGGAFIKSNRAFSTALLAEIDLNLPFDRNKFLETDRLPVHITGHIVRCEKQGFAVQFDGQSRCCL